MAGKELKYIEGVGWRYEIEHNQKRRCRKNNYAEVGTYLVTIVVEGRKPLFGSIRGNIKAHRKDSDYPAIVLSPLGERVLYEELPKINAIYPMVEIWQPVCIMPDHIHLIVRINAPLPPKKHLGIIIGAFKGGVSRAWGGGTLFEDNYNDRILMNDGQLKNWKAYLHANPYRWLVRHTRPELMQRAVCLVIDGVRYGAFGNFMLLRHPGKVQVFFHRRMEDDRLTPNAQGQGTPIAQGQGTPIAQGQGTPIAQGQGTPIAQGQGAPIAQGQGRMIPTELTRFWQREHGRLIEMAEQGDVMVTPGISECEKRIKNECLEHRYRLIHLQDKPIGDYWKPEQSRFEACAAGSLLILAPWAEDLEGETDFMRFHNLNTLAAAICALDADAECQFENTEIK